MNDNGVNLRQRNNTYFSSLQLAVDCTTVFANADLLRLTFLKPNVKKRLTCIYPCMPLHIQVLDRCSIFRISYFGLIISTESDTKLLVLLTAKSLHSAGSLC